MDVRSCERLEVGFKRFVPDFADHELFMRDVSHQAVAVLSWIRHRFEMSFPQSR